MISEVNREAGRIAEKIAGNIDVEKIILFGSHAYGNPGIDSDIDLCIITKAPGRKIELMHRIRRLLRGSIFPVDMIIYNPEEFKKRASSKTSMEHEIDISGIVVYGK